MKVGDGAHQNQNKKGKKNKALTFKLVLPNFYSLSSKLSTLQASSSLNPNAQLAGDEMTIKRMWGRWVGRRNGGRV